MKTKARILVAPLNWGLGHATRCIPIINELIASGYEVVLASDGQALALLKKEFPSLLALSLPAYDVTYAKEAVHFKRNLLLQGPKIWKAVRKEHNVLKEYIEKYAIKGIISDNRLGLYTSKVPCVIITHQIQVLSGQTTWISSILHSRYIKKFTECWVPDYEGEINLSGKLSHTKGLRFPIRHIGALSRFTYREKSTHTYAITAVVSGPEPQRTIFEHQLHKTLKKYNGKTLLVRGRVEDEQEWETDGLCTSVNYLTSQELGEVLNDSRYVIARSGYSTIMDLAKLKKKAFFIPTPGQPEQEYLAQRLKEQGIVPFSTQENFSLKSLSKLKMYHGFEALEEANQPRLRDFFSLFEGKRELRPNSKLAFYINLFFVSLNDVLYNRETESRS